MIKIELKQEEKEKEIIVALLDSGAMELVMSLKFV